MPHPAPDPARESEAQEKRDRAAFDAWMLDERLRMGPFFVPPMGEIYVAGAAHGRAEAAPKTLGCESCGGDFLSRPDPDDHHCRGCGLTICQSCTDAFDHYGHGALHGRGDPTECIRGMRARAKALEADLFNARQALLREGVERDHARAELARVAAERDMFRRDRESALAQRDEVIRWRDSLRAELEQAKANEEHLRSILRLAQADAGGKADAHRDELERVAAERDEALAMRDFATGITSSPCSKCGHVGKVVNVTDWHNRCVVGRPSPPAALKERVVEAARNAAVGIRVRLSEGGWHVMDCERDLVAACAALDAETPKPAQVYPDLPESAFITTDAERDVLTERAKQRAKWGDAHDDGHGDGQMLRESMDLLESVQSIDPRDVNDDWGLVRKHPKCRDRLVIAAALIVAEIERLDRAGAATPKPSDAVREAAGRLREYIDQAAGRVGSRSDRPLAMSHNDIRAVLDALGEKGAAAPATPDLPNERLLELAKRHPAPDGWWDATDDQTEAGA